MTEQLKTLMHDQAESVDFAAPDLAAMVRAGDRRVRTRRLGALAGAAAVLAAVALTAPLLSSSDRAVTPAALGPVAPLTWVEGSTLHADGQVFELSFRPVTYVRTSVGYVFSDRGGRVWSWVDGDVREVGSTDATRPHLVSDDESGLAGWLDPVNGSYAVLDQRPNGSVVHHRAPTGSRPQDFVGIDAGSTYWESGDGLVGFDLATGRSTPIDVGGTIADVEDGLVAIRTEAGISVRDLAGAEVRMLEDFHGEAGSFSPDARYFTNDADVPQVYDVAAGQRVDVSVGDREFASGYEWLDDRTLALIASAEASEDSHIQLVRCTVPDGGCETVTTLMTFAEAVDRLVIPVGTRIDG